MTNLSDIIHGGNGVDAANGFYTPTPTVIKGSASVAPYMQPHYWTRIDDIVTVYGSTSTLSVIPASGDIVIAMTLPVSTANFTAVDEAAGTGTAVYSSLNVKHFLYVRANVGFQRVEIWHEGSTTNNYGWFYTFRYEIQP